MRAKIPEVSLITSFSCHGFEDSLRCLAEVEVQNIELYTFMQHDLQWLQDACPIPGGPAKNTLYQLARLNDEPDAAKIIADCLAAAVRKARGDYRLIGFSSFIPEIMSHEQFVHAHSASQSALCMLVKLAKELHSNHGHPISTMEIVGGSAVDGVWRARHTSAREDVFVVNKLSSSKAISRLLDRLAPVAEIAFTEPRITLSLEMEPGPLYTIGDEEDLLTVCESIELHSSEAVRETIGLNLDIPHWAFLQDISPNWLHENRSVMNRIAHAHISDHLSGHFADGALPSFHEQPDFMRWFDILISLNNRASEVPGYSGYVSCELECCNDTDSVSRSLKTLRDWLAFKPDTSVS